MQPLFLLPIYKERIWGGTALRDEFGYAIPSDLTGECWAISAHPNGASIIKNGRYGGMTLNEVWSANPQLFGNPKEKVFPLLTKILAANMDLSVQVHPDNSFANIYENGELGKTECWYILDCKEDSEIILGHNAKTKEELLAKINHQEWDELLRRVKIKPGDFFYVPSGTVHALCEGALVLETQQSSDATYRLYDYNRKDAEGNLRSLQLEKAIKVMTVPYQNTMIIPSVLKKKNITITTFVESNYFSVYKWNIDGKVKFFFNNRYLLVSVINRGGALIHEGKRYSLKKGTHFIVPVGFGDFQLEGDCELLVSTNGEALFKD